MELKTWQCLELLHVQFLQPFNLQDCKPPSQLTTPFRSSILNMEDKHFEEWPTVALYAITRILNSKYVTVHTILTPLVNESTYM